MATGDSFRAAVGSGYCARACGAILVSQPETGTAGARCVCLRVPFAGGWSSWVWTAAHGSSWGPPPCGTAPTGTSVARELRRTCARVKIKQEEIKIKIKKSGSVLFHARPDSHTAPQRPTLPPKPETSPDRAPNTTSHGTSSTEHNLTRNTNHTEHHFTLHTNHTEHQPTNTSEFGAR